MTKLIQARINRIRSLVEKRGDGMDPQSVAVGSNAAANLICAGFGDQAALDHGLWKMHAFEREIGCE